MLLSTHAQVFWARLCFPCACACACASLCLCFPQIQVIQVTQVMQVVQVIQVMQVLLSAHAQVLWARLCFPGAVKVVLVALIVDDC